MELPTGETVEYVYDDEGIRVSTTVNGETTEYLIDKNRAYTQVLEEFVNDELAAFYVYGHDLIAQQRGDDTSFYHVDGLGSTRALTDELGDVTDTYDYDAFGNLIGSTGDTENSYQYAGEQYDENLDDYYLRQRFYDTSTGRFLRRDTYEGSLDEPLTLHKHLYAHANPTNLTDPTGLYVGNSSDLTSALKAQETLSSQRTVVAVKTLETFRKASMSAIRIVQAVADAYAMAQQATVTLARQFGVPILVYGQDVGQVTEHIADALFFSGNTVDNPSGQFLQSKFISPVLSKEAKRWPTFYSNLSIAKNKKPGESIDEYPYARSSQGGRINYFQNGTVSLRAVPIKDQRRQGNILSRFYRYGQVLDDGENNPASWFVNFASTSNGRTFMIDRKGEKRSS